VIGAALHGADEPRRSVVIAANGKSILATGCQGKQPVAGRGWPGPPARPPVARIIVTIPRLMPSKAVTASTPDADQHGLPQIRGCDGVTACRLPDQITTWYQGGKLS
jgi:hypothetical protein